ncbi:MAG: type II toxin-antitoxin system HicA family toxin [Phycisphaeraceae bacterium]|nr:MAG: type II toxin-antitoxin system HicA family toxin [Phycisphaeraceae bacterium]
MPPERDFGSIKRLLQRHGWSLQRINGSHHIFTGPGRQPISIPVHRGKVKDVYRRQVEKAIREQDAQDHKEGKE